MPKSSETSSPSPEASFIMINPFSSEDDTRSDNFEHNSSNSVIFEKYFKRDCQAQQVQQLSVKCFPKYHFVLEIFSYASDQVSVPDANGLLRVESTFLPPSAETR